MGDDRGKPGRSQRAARHFNVLVGLIALTALLIAAYRVIPPSQVTIATGPVGGSYYENAERYQGALKKQGIVLDLRPNPDSLDIIKDVNENKDGVEIGFVARNLDPETYVNTMSLGAIEQQPLFIFAAKSLGNLSTPAGLLGHRLVMPPRRSVSSEAALSLLADYGVTEANASVTHLPIAQAVEALRQNHFDAGFFMLDPQDRLIGALASDADLQLIDLHDTLTLSRLNPSLHPVILPHGAFDLPNENPPQDVHMVAATINVVVSKHVPQAIVYVLLEAMADAHRGTSLINDAGTFPNLVDVALPPHPLAVDFERNGLPWTYQNLPRWMASLVNSYLIIGLIFVVLIQLWSSILYLAQLVDFLYDHFWLRVLRRIERRARKGQGLRPTDLRLLDLAERAILRIDRRRRGEELIRRIRSPQI